MTLPQSMFKSHVKNDEIIQMCHDLNQSALSSLKALAYTKIKTRIENDLFLLQNGDVQRIKEKTDSKLSEYISKINSADYLQLITILKLNRTKRITSVFDYLEQL